MDQNEFFRLYLQLWTKGSYGKSPLRIGNSSINGSFSIAASVYQRVSLGVPEQHVPGGHSSSCHDPHGSPRGPARCAGSNFKISMKLYRLCI